MHASHFDLAIAGDSLAARMTAAVLAKHGKRVLLFSAPVCRDTWHLSSLFVDKVLAKLGGHDCLSPGRPFQVISSRARVTVTPGLPLAAELNREFGETAPRVTALLADMEHLGTALESLLDEHGGLPAGGLAETARWRWLCLRRKLRLAELTAPLAGRLHGFPEPAGEWLRDLFQGLALRPLDTLTVADGALLWAHGCRPGLNDEKLRELLHKRFEQFHGVETDLETLRAFEHGGGHWVFSLQGGGRFQAGQLIIGDLGRELAGHGNIVPRQCQEPARHYLTSALDGQVSPLLTQHVIPGGSLPMRLAFNAAAGGLTAQVGTLAAADETRVHRQLAPILPFARYKLAEQEYCHAASAAAATPAGALPLFRLPFHLGSHLWCADEARLLPQLGTGGAALLAWTLARQIDPTIAGHGN